MTFYLLRGGGQIRAGTATPIDGTDWHNILVFTTTVNSGGFGYGQQFRPIYANPSASIPEGDLNPGTLTFPKGASISFNAALGYVNDTNGNWGDPILYTDPFQFARFRLNAGTVAVPDIVPGFEEIIPESNLTAYVCMKQSAVAGLALPAKTSTPITGDLQNGDGNYTVSVSRRFILRLPENLVITPGSGKAFAIQARTNAANRGFEYDASAAVILS